MNLQQIEGVCAIVRNGFNISAAAQALERPQPTLSRQIKDLELEVGARVFFRTRNKVVGLTPEGEQVLRLGQCILRDVDNMLHIGNPGTGVQGGELKIATTHLHARYSLPAIMKAFAARFPGVVLTLRQGDPLQCCDLIAAGEADIGVTTVPERTMDRIVAIPAFRLSRCVIAPRDHPLVREKRLTLAKLAGYPIVAYSTPFSGRAIVEAAFASAGLRPHVVCSAIDADVCKTYVELGMGVAVLARIAFDPARDRHLQVVEAGHLFRPTVANLVFRKYSPLKRHAEEFALMFAAHISRDLVQRIIDGMDIDRTNLSQKAPLAKCHA
jgi:LysR family cys regulon transcriptional activator